ncbi:uncharacterized mitochondrial protein-like protein [Tanacetum coccineum]|uniref:Uncharacterized mitochondrial protein-like protein n=1 Tax=Tanacetum coccineum TaxID=301880 RepID=A0ABQ5CQ43_9ASTR
MNEEKYTPPKCESNTDEDDVWYFDNGANNHMTGNYSYFSELDENITGRVRFEDGSCVSIKGKGSILFQGIEVSQERDCVKIKQERYARKILKEAGMEDCNATLYPMEKDIKLSKAEDEPEVEATQYQKMVGCLRYLLHTSPDLIYRLVCSHNVDIDDGRNTTRHVFYLGTSPITWCSQKQTTVALFSCEAEFMAATAAACQAIWLRDLLAKVTGLERQKVIIIVDNKLAIALSKNPIFHGRSKHIHNRYHFIREYVENEQVIVEHVSGENQRADLLAKALARIRFKEMRFLLVVQEYRDMAMTWQSSNDMDKNCWVGKIIPQEGQNIEFIDLKRKIW